MPKTHIETRRDLRKSSTRMRAQQGEAVIIKAFKTGRTTHLWQGFRKVPFSLGTLIRQLRGLLVGGSASHPIRWGRELSLMHTGSLRGLCANGQSSPFVFCLFWGALIQAGCSKNAYTTGSYIWTKQRKSNLQTGLINEWASPRNQTELRHYRHFHRSDTGVLLKTAKQPSGKIYQELSKCFITMLKVQEQSRPSTNILCIHSSHWFQQVWKLDFWLGNPSMDLDPWFYY